MVIGTAVADIDAVGTWVLISAEESVAFAGLCPACVVLSRLSVTATNPPLESKVWVLVNPDGSVALCLLSCLAPTERAKMKTSAETESTEAEARIGRPSRRSHCIPWAQRRGR